jgi:hypothetical protein
MSLNPSLYQTAAHYAEMFAAKILARDNLYLSPREVSRAAALRLKQGIMALEAYLRRLLFVLALHIEHELKPDTKERPIYARAPRKRGQKASFKTLPYWGIEPDFSTIFEHKKWADRQPPKPVPLAPLLKRLAEVRDILKNPEARARRLAYHLARKQSGPLLAPRAHDAVRNRYGTEFSAIYTAMSAEIGEMSRARPPPIGPVLRPPPRIRRL